jgi:hypothetical protein
MVYDKKIVFDWTFYARATVNYADCKQQKIVQSITREVFHVVNEVGIELSGKYERMLLKAEFVYVSF